MHVFRLIGRAVALAEDTLLVGLLTSLIGLGTYQIAMRNFGGSSPAWTDELLRILVLWLAMTGAMAAARSANHITIDLVSRMVSPRMRHAISTLSSLFTAAVSMALAYYCFEFVKIEHEFGSTVLKNVSAWTVQSIMPVGFAAIAVRYLCHSANEALTLVKGEQPDEEGATP